MGKYVVGFWLVGSILGVAFYLHPQWDLNVATMFYTPEQGFLFKHHIIAHSLYHFIPYMVKGYLSLLFISIALLHFCKKHPLGWDKRVHLYLVLSLALGPGVMVNTVLKNHWGRARPLQIEAFRGTKQFTPAFVKTDQCVRNCSFVSGHAAMGFAVSALAFVLPTLRGTMIMVALMFGGSVGLARMAQGAHFMSDVIFAGFFVIGINMLLAYAIFFYDRKDA